MKIHRISTNEYQVQYDQYPFDEVLIQDIERYKYDDIHLNIITKDGRIFHTTLPDVNTIMDKLRKKEEYNIKQTEDPISEIHSLSSDCYFTAPFLQEPSRINVSSCQLQDIAMGRGTVLDYVHSEAQAVVDDLNELENEEYEL